MKQEALDIRYSLDTIDDTARELWAYARGYRIWAFDGDMGAGKTTLINSLCKLLGVRESTSSPTFSLINEYHFHNSEEQETAILHMDWYRLKDAAEAIDAGVEDALLSGKYCFIEWPGKAAEIIPGKHISIKINAYSHENRFLHAQIAD